MNLDLTLDLSGLNCPLPILRAKRALSQMQGGAVLAIVATDPGAPADFEAFCRHTGNQLLESSITAEGKFYMVLQRRIASKG